MYPLKQLLKQLQNRVVEWRLIYLHLDNVPCKTYKQVEVNRDLTAINGDFNKVIYWSDGPFTEGVFITDMTVIESVDSIHTPIGEVGIVFLKEDETSSEIRQTKTLNG